MSQGEKWKAKTVNAFSEMKVVMDNTVWEHLMGWCKAADSEVSGMMLVEYDAKEKCLRVPSIYLPKQECDSSSTEIDDDALAGLQMKLHAEKKNLKDLRGWWHTHYNFSTFWSGTDTATIEKLMAGNDWFLSIVVNQAEEFKARLDISSPFPIVIDDMDIEVIGLTEDLSKYKKDIDAQVSKKAHHVSSYGGVGYEHYHWRQQYGDDYPGYWRGRQDFSKPDKPKAKTDGYDGKWWKRFDPENWHGFKAGKSTKETAETVVPSPAKGQSEADFKREQEADAAIEAYEREAMLAEDDPMMMRLEGLTEEESAVLLGFNPGAKQ